MRQSNLESGRLYRGEQRLLQAGSKVLLQKSELPPQQIFAYELGAALAVQHLSGHFLFHLLTLSAVDAESSLNLIQMFFTSLVVQA